ncbi:MAG TPA: archease [Gemmatimonadales bacterium]|nr:archease [Gemmatimonadales bacterium]
MSASHRFEESDELRLVIRADSFPEAAAEAGRALAAMAGAAAPVEESDGWAEVSVEAADRAALLVDWINELIFRAESEGWLGTDFEVVECSPTRLRVRARRLGWPSRSLPVKAATLDRARVVDDPGGVTAEVTLDL